MNKKIPLLAGFLIPLLIALVICIDHGVYPLGEQCILQVDMYHQYCPFFSELQEKLKTGGSMFYSWNIGLGADFISLFAYYLASPLNIFLLLCPKNHVIEFMTILVLLKMALSGLTFTYYLIEHFQLNGSKSRSVSESHQLLAFAASIFGCAYALSAFMAAYAWNIMWLDCMVLLPMVILGLERLVREESPKLYYVALALCIWCNFYIAIMVCIFAVLWFLVSWFEHRKAGYMPWFCFGWYSLLAGGTSAVLIIPTAIVLGYSGNQGGSFPDTIEWYFDILSELARHMMLVETYTGAEHWPNIYCGVLVLVLFVMYLLNTGISWKRKVPRVFFLGLFVISFANNILDYIWHGLHFPTSLPGRQSFIYIFLLLLVAFEAFVHLRENKRWHVIVAAVVNMIFVGVSYHVSDAEMLDKSVFVISAVFIGCYLVLVAGYLLGNAKVRRVMLAIGCLTVIAELTLNHDITGLDTVSRAAYTEYMDSYEKLLVAAELRADDTSFYRVEGLERKTKNDAALYGYPSATQFSSLMNLDVSHFYQDVGMEGGKNFYCANGATPLLSAMLSLRYVLADNGMEAGPLRTEVMQSGNAWLYENKYVLPLGFMMSEDVICAWDYENSGDIEAQNRLAVLLGAKEAMLMPVSSVSGAGVSTIEIAEDGYYYATYEKTSVSQLKLEVSDGRTRTYSKASHGYTLELGYCRAGTIVEVTNEENETVVLSAYRLNEEALGTAFDALNFQTMQLTALEDDFVQGTIEVAEPGRLIFAIANEDGWNLYVDGIEVEKEVFGEGFISVGLETGRHEVELVYRTPGYEVGKWISLICVVAAIVSLAVAKKNTKRIKNISP